MSKISAELALALALDGKLTKVDDETATLVAVVDALRSLPEPQIDAAFATALEQRLLTEGLDEAPAVTGRPALRLVSEPAPADDDVIRVWDDNVVAMPTRRFKVRKSVAAIAACFMLGAFPVMAAATSLPGSPFYGLKQGMHSAKIALFGGPAQDASWRLGFAAEHVREAEALVGLGASDELVSEALDLASYELAKAAETIAAVTDTDDLVKFAKEAEATEALLQKSAPTLVPGAREAFDRAMEAAQTLTAVVSDTLGFDGNPIAPAIAAIAADAAEIADDLPGSVPTTVEAEGSGSAKVSTKEQESGSKTPTTNEQPKENNGGQQTRTGKALEETATQSCALPGSYNLHQLTGDDVTTEVCYSIVSSIG